MVLLQGPLCAGLKKRQVTVGPHLLVEVIAEKERLANVEGEMGVRDPVRSSLHSIPRNVSYKNTNFSFRGVVSFEPPIRDSGIGHYRGYALRKNGSWELYDDIREKVIFVDGSVEVNTHILVYTL